MGPGVPRAYVEPVRVTLEQCTGEPRSTMQELRYETGYGGREQGMAHRIVMK